MTREIYINTVLKYIKNKAAHPEIKAELDGHIADRIDFFKDMGYSDEKASERAVEKMGNADETGKKLARLNNYPLAIIKASIAFTFFLAAVLAYIFTYAAFFAILSPDPQPLEAEGLIISCAAFIASAACFRVIYKNRLAVFSIVYGAVNIIVGLTCWLIFNPIGYGIIGFFTSFIFNKGHLINSSLSPNLSYIQNLTLSNILYYITIGFIILFMLSPMINGIIALKLGIKLQKDTLTEKNKKNTNRFTVLFLAIAIFGVIASTAEIAAPLISRYNDITAAERSFDEDAKEVTEFMLALGKPESIDEARKTITSLGYKYDYYETEFDVNINKNFKVNIAFENGRLSRIYAGCKYRNIEPMYDFEKEDVSLSAEELIEKYGFEKISRYFYQNITDGKNKGVYEDVDFTIMSKWDLIYYYSQYENFYFKFKDGMLQSTNAVSAEELIEQ